MVKMVTTGRNDWLQGHFDRGTQLVIRTPKHQLLLLCAIIVSTFFLFHEFPRFSNGPSLPSTGGQDSLVLGKNAHPIEVLVESARSAFAKLKARQSSSLNDAVREYKRRYKLDPPPHFDKWFTFVQENKIPLADEYDGIYNALQPFWGFSPAVIRNHVKRALGSDEFLIAIFIRGGKIASIERGPEWKQNAIKSVIEPFVHLLPDMDLAFNMHDEPRVISPYDQMTQLTSRAHSMIQQQSSTHKRGMWSDKPMDMNSGFIESNAITPFMDYAHRFTWQVGTLSCPSDSPARILNYDGTNGVDEQSAHAYKPLGFVTDHVKSSDVCQYPSLQNVHGFFNMPNAWSITHEPIPIFSPSKVSTFHDILYPAPWYLGDQVVYDEAKDFSWDNKNDTLYWRGSTTSGYSDGSVWRRQGRQRFVEAVEKSGQGVILEKSKDDGTWSHKEISRETYWTKFDVHFSHVGQCSEKDCAEERAHFDIRPENPYDDNWRNKFLLDIDGNAFSGRFHTFLKSRSLVLKQALFREWHQDRIIPWAHYIPLGFNNTDYLEAMRFLTEEQSGRALAEELAQDSRDWAFASLRKVDMQAWMFRLLLEYARLVDDLRSEIGFVP